MPPGGRQKRGRSGGLSTANPAPKRKPFEPKPKAQAAIVRPEIRRNNARCTFAGIGHRRFVSCEDECWHEIAEAESTIHNAFLTLNVPKITELNLPKPESYARALVSHHNGAEQNLMLQRIRIDSKARTLPCSAAPETGHYGFLTLKFSNCTRYSRLHIARLSKITSIESYDLSRHQDDPSSQKFSLSKGISRRIDRPNITNVQFTENIRLAQVVDLASTYPRSQSAPALIATNEGYEKTPLASTPLTSAFSLITPTALFDVNTLDIQCNKSVPNVPFHFQIDKLIQIAAMAPVRDPVSVQQSMKDVIQILYDMQSQVHGFVPETQSHLIDKVSELATSLSNLQTLTSKEKSPNNPIHDIRIAPEFIDYVDDGRNPDIYTRDFVELVQRGNSVINGKQKAFRDFSEVYAKALKEGFNGIEKEVDEVMANAGLDEKGSSIQNDRQNGN